MAKKEETVRAVARSGFLLDGEHVETGTELDLEFGFFRLLETAGKVMRAPESETESAPEPKKGKGA